MMQGIQNIIFDLGGVIINLDYGRTEQAFIDAGITDFKERYTQLQQTPLFDQFEMGKISKDDFINTLIDMSPLPITEEDVVAAWNAMLLNFPLRRLQILQQLRLHHGLFLLSNTNELHELAFNQILYREHGMPNIGVFFDKAYLSHRVGLRKPMKEIFELVLNENGLEAGKTLFIDDSPQHIEGAISVGLQTIWLEKGMTMEHNIFRNRI